MANATIRDIDRSFRQARSRSVGVHRIIEARARSGRFLPRFPDNRPSDPRAAVVMDDIIRRNVEDQDCAGCGERVGAHAFMDDGDCPDLASYTR